MRLVLNKKAKVESQEVVQRPALDSIIGKLTTSQESLLSAANDIAHLSAENGRALHDYAKRKGVPEVWVSLEKDLGDAQGITWLEEVRHELIALANAIDDMTLGIKELKEEK